MICVGGCRWYRDHHKGLWLFLRLMRGSCHLGSISDSQVGEWEPSARPSFVISSSHAPHLHVSKCCAHSQTTSAHPDYLCPGVSVRASSHLCPNGACCPQGSKVTLLKQKQDQALPSQTLTGSLPRKGKAPHWPCSAFPLRPVHTRLMCLILPGAQSPAAPRAHRAPAGCLRAFAPAVSSRQTISTCCLSAHSFTVFSSPLPGHPLRAAFLEHLFSDRPAPPTITQYHLTQLGFF